MEYISSDTNVWLDFVIIDRLEYPFRLPYTYVMNSDAVHDELLSPPKLGEILKNLGLEEIELTTEEFFLAAEYMGKYAKPSQYDCIALAIAKVRGIKLLTGDKALRDAAKNEGVTVIGTIGILDLLYNELLIEKHEYSYCLKELQKHNGGKIRLPEAELRKRIDLLQN